MPRDNNFFFSNTVGRIELDGYAAQNKFYGVDHTETTTPGYLLFNAGWGTTLITKKGKALVKLFLQVDNLLDKVYQSHLNRLNYFEYYEFSPNGLYGNYNMGRNVSVKAIVPF
ncbi:MAG: hypothetical protein ABJA37_07895 [Ferruginibacter sp.]